MRVKQACVGLILNYRDWRRSQHAIGSLLDDGVDAVVVWDNSEDGGDSAARLAAALPTDAPVRIHVSASNLGFAAGVNRGLELCASLYPSTWVLLINNDAKLVPGALDVLAKVLSDAPDTLIAYPAIAQGGAVRGTAY